MQVFFRSVLAAAFLAVVLLSQPAQAEDSADFNTLDFYFYGDLDNGNGNISTVHPISDTDTASDCPQSANRLSWPGQERQWETVGSWVTEFQTPGEVASGDYTFTIWANSTQGTVEDVEFRISVSIGGGTADAVETSQSKTVTDDSESATRFDINFDITNASFSAGSDMTIDLEYSGGEEGENPLTGGSSTEQIVVLTSSINHPSGVSNMSVNHYSAWFSEITVEEFQDRVYVKTTVASGFGNGDIDSSEWILGVYGMASGNEGMTADINMKSAQNDTYEVSFYWYYNRDNAISDVYNFYIQIRDIQGNSWEVISDEDLYLVIHDSEVDNYLTSEDVKINNQTGNFKVNAGSSFTIDVTISVQGDPLIRYNPIPVSIVLMDGTSEIILYETAVFANPGATAQLSFRHTFDKEGDYTIKVIIDRNNVVVESDEFNNINEFTLEVEENEEDNAIQSLIDDVTGGGATTLVVLLSVSLLLAFAYLRRSAEPDFEWEEDEEF